MGEVNISVKNRAAAAEAPTAAPAAARRDDLGVLPGLLGYNLRRTQEAVFAAFMDMVTAQIEPAGLTPGQFGVLAIVVANPGLKQIELGAALGVDRSTIVASVDKLEKRGLVERRPVPHDRRAHALTLTGEGQRVYRTALGLVEGHEAQIADGLDAAERAQLLDLLGRVQRAAQRR